MNGGSGKPDRVGPFAADLLDKVEILLPMPIVNFVLKISRTMEEGRGKRGRTAENEEGVKEGRKWNDDDGEESGGGGGGKTGNGKEQTAAYVFRRSLGGKW
jgi:hypothetical protein